MKLDPALFGQPEQGRGVVVRERQAGPRGWKRIRVDGAALSDPGGVVSTLHRHWLLRQPVVIELAVDALELKTPQTEHRRPYELGCDFEFLRERLHFLVWANNVDATRDQPIWWLDRLAGEARAGRPTDGGPRDERALGYLHRESLDLRRAGLGKRAGLPAQKVPALGSLTARQSQAVLHDRGPARVIAPAGSGKTRVLTGRLLHLLGVRGIEPELVTAVAYNRRARQELELRTQGLPCRPEIRTIHSLALAILREARDPRVLNEVEVRRLLATLVPQGERRRNQDFLAPYLEALARVRVALVEPEQAALERDDVPEFVRVFETYRRVLRDRNLVDYDEQIFAAIELLCRDSELRAKWQLRCRHLLVDEFQDLTPSYLLLLRLLSSPTYQVFAVGDDDQVIYGYSGADPRFLVRFEDYFPQASSYDLGINFRCPVGVVHAARNLVERNKARVRKSIEPGPEASESGLHLLSKPAHEEAEAALKVIQDWLQQGARAEEIAVLTRVNSLLLPLQLGLRQRGIPYHSSLRAQSLQSAGMQTALSYLRVASSPEDVSSEDLAQTLRRPNRKLRRAFLDQIDDSRVRSLSVLQRAAQSLQDWEAEKVEEYLTQVRALAEILRRQGAAAALRFLRTTVGLGAAMEELDRSSGPVGSGGGHLDDLLALEQAAGHCADLAELELQLTQGLSEGPGEGGVCLSSVHRVKGQEWPRVLLYGVRSGVFPHRLSGPEGLEEERRVFHVALTRARQEVALLVDREEPSPFVAELAPRARKARPGGKSVPSLQPGQQVWHQMFGQGKVSMVHDQIATVSFEKGPSRKIKISYLQPLKL